MRESMPKVAILEMAMVMEVMEAVPEAESEAEERSAIEERRISVRIVRIGVRVRV